MKIAFVSTRYAPNEVGGAERTVRTLAEALVRRGHQSSVTSLAPTGEATVGELNGVTLYYLPLANVFAPWEKKQKQGIASRALWHLVDAYNPIMGREVGRILDIERPDVLHASSLLGFSVSVWRAASKRNIPVVQMLHDYYLGCPNSAMYRNGRNCQRQCRTCHFYGLARRKMSNTPAAVISLSEFMLGRLEDCGLFNEIRRKSVIHGVNDLGSEVGDPKPEVGKPGRADAAGELVVGYLGRIDPTKGVETLLDAVHMMKHPGVRVVLGGTGEEHYVSRLRQRYASERISFSGHVEPPEFFERIDLLVVPSLWEDPLPRVIYEAYSYGVPVIGSRIGGIPEIVDVGRTGFLVTAGDSQELATLLEGLVQDWRSERYTAACLDKGKEFSAAHRFEEFYQVWAQAAGK